MNKIAGAIFVLSAAVTGHAALSFLAAHPQIRRHDVPEVVAHLVVVAIATSGLLGLMGVVFLFRRD